MKKTILIILMMASLSLAAAQTAEDVGCTLDGKYYKCQEPAIILNAEIKLNADIKCFSSNTTSCISDCAGQIDYGCYSVGELLQPIDVQDCYSYIGNISTAAKANTCTTVTLDSGKPSIVSINPYAIDYSKCSKEVKNESYVITCPSENEAVTINATMSTDYSTIIIVEMSAKTSVEDTIMSNIVYIALGVIVILLAVWAFMPRKGKKVKK